MSVAIGENIGIFRLEVIVETALISMLESGANIAVTPLII